MSKFNRIAPGEWFASCAHVKLNDLNPKIYVFDARGPQFDPTRVLDEMQKARWIMLCPSCHDEIMQTANPVCGAPFSIVRATREITLPRSK